MKIQSRFIVDLPCAFGATLGTPRNGTITSIEIKGCFVKTTVTVAQEQALFVRVWTNENRWLRLRGTVKYHMEKVGFSLTFGDLEEGDLNDLTALIEGLRRQSQTALHAFQGEEAKT